MTRLAALTCVVGLVCAGTWRVDGQAPATVTIAVVVDGADGRPQPVPRFALQITDNPASAPPRRTVTGTDGTVDVRLAPGNYTIESQRPFTVGPAIYQWAVTVEVAAGQRTVVTLSTANAERVDDARGAPRADGRVEHASLVARWQSSVAEVWSPTAHGAAVVMGPGLVATDRSVVGAAPMVEVQLSPTLKVEGIVAATDASTGIALVRFDRGAAEEAGRTAVPCEVASATPAVSDEVAALTQPLGQGTRAEVGYVDAVSAVETAIDLDAEDGTLGAPVFNAALEWIGLAVVTPPREEARADRVRVIPAARVCAAAQGVGPILTTGPAPSPMRLPVEPSTSPRREPTSGTVARSSGMLSLPRMTSDDFDITFLAPSRVSFDGGRSSAEEPWQQLLSEFANWTAYVERRWPVLLVRVTPRLTEGLWGKLARGAALTQGVSLPPIKRLKPNFARLRAFCDTAEIRPIHPFVLQHQLSDTDPLIEGLYVFDPASFVSGCTAIRLHLSSVAAPDRADIVTVPPQVLSQLRRDVQ